MLDLLIKLTDRIIDLSRERENRRKGIFNEFYRDLFDRLSEVHANYLISLQIIKDATSSKNSTEELSRVIDKERATLKGARDYIDASIGSISGAVNSSAFEKWESSFLTEIDTYLRSYFNGRTSFTGLGLLLDEMSRELSERGYSESDEYFRRYKKRTFREHVIDEIERTERWLEKQYSDICVLYNAIRIDVYSDG